MHTIFAAVRSAGGLHFRRRCLAAAFCLLAFCLPAAAQPAAEADAPDFYARFDGTLAAVGRDGRTIEPLAARGVTFVEGLRGKAAYIGGNGDKDYDKAPLLEYPAEGLLDGPTGTLMFWVRPDWDGEIVPGKEPPYYRFFDAGPKLNIFLYHWLRCDIGVVPVKASEKPGQSIQLVSHSRAAWLRGDWWHVALTWDGNGWTKLYVNGLPYSHGMYAPGPSAVRRALDFGRIERFFVGSQAKGTFPGNMRADAAFAELKIYRRSLPDARIMAEYRRVMPLDMASERRFLRAGQPEQVAVDVWPGGQMIRPPVGDPVPTPVKTTVEATLTREADGKVVARREFPVTLNGLKTLSLPVSGLDEGTYRATYRLSGGEADYRKSYRVYAYRQQGAAAASPAPVKLGAPVLTIDCAATPSAPLEKGETRVVDAPGIGKYRESAPARDSRFSYELDLSALAKEGRLDGRPMMLEVYWPDDKPRSMGLYLYRESRAKEQRDRLQGGIHGGAEYTASGRLQKTSYLFYPWTARYLFEARTVVSGYPAAVSRIVVRPVIGRLPRLPIATPPGGGRDFGHLDEDQTWDVMFAYDSPEAWNRRAVRNMEMLLDYMDYTGQNVLSYPFIRYGDIQYDLPGAMAPRGAYFNASDGWRALMLDMLAARGKKLIASLNGYSIMEAHKMPDRQEALLTEDYFQRDKTGQPAKDDLFGKPLANPLHPLYRRQFMGHLEELLRRFGKHPALGGIDLWTYGDWQIRDLDNGYDDLAVATFTRETGIAVPGGEGEERFARRYAFLTGPKRREWLAWRAKKNAEFLTAMVRAIRATNPKLTLGLNLSGTPMQGSTADVSGESLDFATYYYEEHGLDVKSLQRIPGLSVVPVRWSTKFRWHQHRNGSFSTSDELLNDLARQSIFRGTGENRAYTYLTYYESFNDSLKPETYSAYFQNADIKPHGRFFLKELAMDVASTDPSTILVGAQPIGTSGRDDEAREFARAFRALPSGNFRDVPGSRDPVCVRSLTMPQGTYLYLQNLIDTPVTVTLSATSRKALDLGSGQPLTRAGREWSLTLKPFQLRSLRLGTGETALRVRTVAVPADARARYAAFAEEARRGVAALREGGADAAPLVPTATALERAVREGRYAEAHRLYFGKRMRALPDLAKSARQGYEKQRKEMLAAGHVAIKCGSDAYYRTSTGALFFPDRTYAPGGYGFFGSHNTAAHPVESIKETRDRDLFSTEAYNVQGYRFTVPKGAYTVRLYNRIGYAPDAAPGKVVMTLDIQGRRVWENRDLFLALEKDAGRTLTSEFRGVVVEDGTLTVEWGRVNDRLGWCNAIEVVREKN